MSNFFNMDNGFFRALGRLADLMILNLLFIVCSLPIFTIGASTTAMYYVTLKMAENEEGYIARGFWKSFKQNFRQATIIWLILLFIGIVLLLDLFILNNSTGQMADVLRIIIIATFIFYLILTMYVFPTLARFYNSIRQTMKNAFIMAVANLPRTVAVFVITVGSVMLTFLNTYTLWYGSLIWVLAGFAAVAYANSFFLKKVFARYIPKDDEEGANPDDWNADAAEATSLDAKAEDADAAALDAKDTENADAAALDAKDTEDANSEPTED